MARHLLIGNSGVASLVNAASETDLAVNIQKLSANGPVNMVAGDTVADSDSFRVVQGTAGNNIVSPWIKGRNVVNWSGSVAAAQAAQVETVTLADNATAAKTITLKVINKSNGVFPQEFKSFDFAALASATPTVQATGLFAAMTGNLPHWINTVTDGEDGVLTFTGFKKGQVNREGMIVEDVVLFDFADDIDGSNGTTATYSVTTASSKGSGDGFYIQELESSLQGISHGYYNRVHLPKAPGLTGVATTSYDMYSIVATKDGSTSSSINGVDNLIEISIASTAGNAAGPILEGKLNSYMASLNFPVVVL